MPEKKTEATATATVSLREVNTDTVGAVCGLSNNPHGTQEELCCHQCLLHRPSILRAQGLVSRHIR